MKFILSCSTAPLRENISEIESCKKVTLVYLKRAKSKKTPRSGPKVWKRNDPSPGWKLSLML